LGNPRNGLLILALYVASVFPVVASDTPLGDAFLGRDTKPSRTYSASRGC